jgi:hypothetical protein
MLSSKLRTAFMRWGACQRPMGISLPELSALFSGFQHQESRKEAYL